MTSGTFSTRLLEVIRSRGLSKRAAAELCNINYHTLNAVLTRENSVPNAKIALQIADGLGVGFEWLVSGRSDRGAPINILGLIGSGGKVDARRANSASGVLVELPKRLLQRQLGSLLVDGSFLEPFFQPGDVLFFEDSTEQTYPLQPDSRPHLVHELSGTKWIKFLRVCPDTGDLESFELCEDPSTARKAEIQSAVPVLLTVSGTLVELIY